MGGIVMQCASATESAVCQIKLSDVHAMHAASRPEASMERVSLRRNRQVRYTPRASPSASKPGPRLALEAGTRRVNHRLESGRIFAQRRHTKTPRFSEMRAAARRLRKRTDLADLQNVLFLGLGGRVDLIHVRIGQFLDFVVGFL